MSRWPDRRAVVAGAAVVLLTVGWWVDPSGARSDGEYGPWGVSLHTHASLSEKSGTMHGYYFQAGPDLDERNDVDVIYFTDHAEWQEGYLQEYVFTYDMCPEGLEGGPCASCESPPCQHLALLQDTVETVCEGTPRQFDVTLSKDWLAGGSDFEFTVALGLPPTDAAKGTPGFSDEALHFRSALPEPAPETGFVLRSWKYATAGLRHRQSLLSGLTVQLSIWTDRLSPDVQPGLTVRLSHSASEGVAVPLSMHYLLTPTPGDLPPSTASDLFFWMGDRIDGGGGPVAGAWNRITLDLSADALGFDRFPESPGDEQALQDLSLVARVRGPADLYFDDLRMTRRRIGQELYEHQAEVLRTDPYLTSAAPPYLYQAQEVCAEECARSGGVHVTVFGSPCLALHDYDDATGDPACSAPEHRVPWCEADAPTDGSCPADPELTRFPANVTGWIDELRRSPTFAGQEIFTGVAHMFGAGFFNEASSCRSDAAVDAIYERLRCRGVYGATTLEVGYQIREFPFSEHVRVWDRLGQDLLFVTGTAVTDSHFHHTLAQARNRGLSWVYTEDPVPTHAAIADALVAGRLFGGDLRYVDTGSSQLGMELALYTGDVSCEERDAHVPLARMGQVYTLDDANASSTFTAIATWGGLDAEAIGPGPVEIRTYRQPDGVLARRRVEPTDDCFAAGFTTHPPTSPPSAQVVRTTLWVYDPETACCDSQDELGCNTTPTHETPVLFTNPIYVVNAPEPIAVPPERLPQGS